MSRGGTLAGSIQIVVKVREELAGSAERLVRDAVARLAAEPLRARVRIECVFPGAPSPRRAALVAVSVPDDADAEQLAAELRRDEAIERAEIPAERRPL